MQDKDEKTIKLDMSHLGESVPDVTLTYKPPTAGDYRRMAKHRTTDEEYTFWLCVYLLEADGNAQPEEWWEELPLTEFAKAAKFALSKMPKPTPEGASTDPLG